MGKKAKAPYEQKIEAITNYLSGQISIIRIAHKYSLNVLSVKL